MRTEFPSHFIGHFYYGRMKMDIIDGSPNTFFDFTTENLGTIIIINETTKRIMIITVIVATAIDFGIFITEYVSLFILFVF
jgi:hypothetical protein